MNNQMINLIKEAYQDESKFKYLENIYALYDDLQYSENLNEMADSLFEWLHKKYEITNLNFSLYDIDTDKSSLISKKGTEFYLDGEFSFYFVINTHSSTNAVVSFLASSQEHYDSINQQYNFMEAAFFQISPVLQNGIMKKNHIESSSIDSVTNVYNRKYLVSHIHKLTTMLNKEKDAITFLMIGIDHFKAVIDEFDYEIGDKVLIELSKSIHRNINDFDIVARLTGDEFIVALINLKDKSEAIDIGNKIIKDFSEVETLVDSQTEQTLKKTICIGISSYPHDNDNINEVLKNADRFLYEAKNMGRSKLAIYSKEDLNSIDLF